MPSEVQPIYRYNNNPPGILHWENVVRTLSQPLMELVADGMIYHITDMQYEDLRPDWVGQELAVDPAAPLRQTLLDYVRADSRWGLPLVQIMGVDTEKIFEANLRPEGWHYVFDIWPDRLPHDGKVIRSKIVMPLNEKARILVAREPVRAYCVDTKGNNLPFTLSAPIHRRHPAFRQLRLI